MRIWTGERRRWGLCLAPALSPAHRPDHRRWALAGHWGRRGAQLWLQVGDLALAPGCGAFLGHHDLRWG